MRFSCVLETERLRVQNKGPFNFKDLGSCFNKFRNVFVCKYLKYRSCSTLQQQTLNMTDEKLASLLKLFYTPLSSKSEACTA